MVQERGLQRRNSFWAEQDRRRLAAADPARRRRALRLSVFGFVAAVALPILLWRDVVAGIASEFRLDLHYLLSEWSPWILIALGLAFCLPVVWSAGADPESRWYPRSRNAYAGWGITLYLLGLALGTQVAQIYELHAG